MSELVPGLCSVTFRALAPEDVVALAARTGLAAIEWAGDVHVPHGDLEAAARIAVLCADAGVTCASYGSYAHAGDLRPGEVDAVLDTAEALGAPNVRVWCALRADAGPDADRTVRAHVAAEVAKVARAAAARGLTTSLEFHVGTLTQTAASTRRLLADVGVDDLYTYWQPMGWLADDQAVAELRAVRDDLSHLHLLGHDGTVPEWSTPLSERASLVCPALAEAATGAGRWDAQGRPRVAFLEFVAGHRPEQLLDDAAVLRTWITSADPPARPATSERGA